MQLIELCLLGAGALISFMLYKIWQELTNIYNLASYKFLESHTGEEYLAAYRGEGPKKDHPDA